MDSGFIRLFLWI